MLLRGLRVAGMIALALWALPVQASFTGLLLIPTADVLGTGGVNVGVQTQGRAAGAHGATDPHLNTQVGAPHSEFGMDIDVARHPEAGAIFNGKLQVMQGDRRPLLAVGVYNVGEHSAPSGYVAASSSAADRLRLHAGAFVAPEPATQGFAGVQYTLSPQFQLWAEAIAGEGNNSAYTLTYSPNGRFVVSLGWQRPNDPRGEGSLVLEISCLEARPAESR